MSSAGLPVFYPPSNSFPPQTAFHFGGPSDPLSRVGSFQGTLMDANGGLFQIILQGRALICRLACSPQAGYPENMHPPLDTHTKTPVKKLQEHEGRKEEPRRVHRHERKDWECDSEKTKENVKKAGTKKEKVQERDALGGRMVVRACGGCVCAVEN